MPVNNLRQIVGKMSEMDIQNFSEPEIDRVFQNAAAKEWCVFMANVLIQAGLTLQMVERLELPEENKIKIALDTS